MNTRLLPLGHPASVRSGWTLRFPVDLFVARFGVQVYFSFVGCAYAESEESSGYKREQFIERLPSTWMTWHRSARVLSSSEPPTVLFPGYMVHD